MPFAVPFTRSFIAARAAWSVREGAILRITTDTGHIGTGEIAPLPSHGTLSLADQLAQLERLAPRLCGRRVDDLPEAVMAALGEDIAHAPLRCAIETAALDAAARAAGRSVARLLAACPATSVDVNAVIDATGAKDAAEAAGRAVSHGFRTVKVKVGTVRSMAGEVARVAAVRDAIGTATGLRLDANGAWSEQRAVETLRAIEGCAIEVVEQPVPASHIDALARVRAAVPQPIAADESVTGIESVRAIIDQRAADTLVVKLPVVGGPLRAMEVSMLAQGAGLGVIVTSAIESGIGVAAALHVAAALPQTTPACGLATLDLLSHGLIKGDLPVEAGVMHVPATRGLGVTIDENALDHYATSAERIVRA